MFAYGEATAKTVAHAIQEQLCANQARIRNEQAVRLTRGKISLSH